MANFLREGFPQEGNINRFKKNTAKQNMSNAVCRKRKAIVFIGGRKKFGGGGKSECGMTPSNQKK